MQMKEHNNGNFNYIPPQTEEPVAQKETLGVIFCQDTILLESFLHKFNIEYQPEDLEVTPFGLGLRIKKDREEMLQEYPLKREEDENDNTTR